MTKTISIMIDVTIADETEPEAIAEAVYDFLIDDPDNLFPGITTVDSFDYRILE